LFHTFNLQLVYLSSANNLLLFAEISYVYVCLLNVSLSLGFWLKVKIGYLLLLYS